MTAPLYAIGRFCSRYHWPVIAVWLVAAIVLVAIGQASGSKTNDNLTLPGTGSTTATELLEDNLPEQAYRQQPAGVRGASAAPSSPTPSTRRDRRNGEAAQRACTTSTRRQPAQPAGRRLPQQGPDGRLLAGGAGVGPGDLTESRLSSPRHRRSPPSGPASKSPSAATSASSSPSPTPGSATRSASPRRS